MTPATRVRVPVSQVVLERAIADYLKHPTFASEHAMFNAWRSWRSIRSVLLANSRTDVAEIELPAVPVSISTLTESVDSYIAALLDLESEPRTTAEVLYALETSPLETLEQHRETCLLIGRHLSTKAWVSLLRAGHRERHGHDVEDFQEFFFHLAIEAKS